MDKNKIAKKLAVFTGASLLIVFALSWSADITPAKAVPGTDPAAEACASGAAREHGHPEDTCAASARSDDRVEAEDGRTIHRSPSAGRDAATNQVRDIEPGTPFAGPEGVFLQPSVGSVIFNRNDVNVIPHFSGIDAPWWVSETGAAQIIDDLILWGLTDVRVGLINTGTMTEMTDNGGMGGGAEEQQDDSQESQTDEIVLPEASDGGSQQETSSQQIVLPDFQPVDWQFYYKRKNNLTKSYTRNIIQDRLTDKNSLENFILREITDLLFYLECPDFLHFPYHPTDRPICDPGDFQLKTIVRNNGLNSGTLSQITAGFRAWQDGQNSYDCTVGGEPADIIPVLIAQGAEADIAFAQKINFGNNETDAVRRNPFILFENLLHHEFYQTVNLSQNYGAQCQEEFNTALPVKLQFFTSVIAQDANINNNQWQSAVFEILPLSTAAFLPSLNKNIASTAKASILDALAPAAKATTQATSVLPPTAGSSVPAPVFIYDDLYVFGNSQQEPGNAYIMGELSVGSSVQIAGNLTSLGSAWFDDDLTVYGSSEIRGPLNVNSNITANGTITASSIGAFYTKSQTERFNGGLSTNESKAASASCDTGSFLTACSGSLDNPNENYFYTGAIVIANQCTAFGIKKPPPDTRDPKGGITAIAGCFDPQGGSH